MNNTVNTLHYRMRVIHSLTDVEQKQWDELLQLSSNPNPFLSYAFLHALHESGSACERTGWRPCYLTLWDENAVVAAMPLYEKAHSYGEYVFDWAWADAYHRHGLDYYPKLLSAIPFTPVSGNRLIAKNLLTQQLLIKELIRFQDEGSYSSTHILFPTEQESIALKDAGFLLRQGIQFHWINHGYENFDSFLSTLEQKKRKNIRAERRKVAQEGVEFRHIQGQDMTETDWQVFKSCYDHTYAEHNSTPYLNLDFFLRIGRTMPEHIHLVFATLNNQVIAASLLIHNEQTVYGRYWGCLKEIDCLHFETSYYQAIEFCIANKIKVFEGGAQGEHKIARGFLPQKTTSAHHLTEPGFSDAVALFLQRETGGVEQYLSDLNDRTPFKSTTLK
ncbi:GNAT family N-acetyltransferase [soil metagenome]